MNILVALDFSSFTKKILKKTEEISKPLSAKVTLLHVAEPNPDFVGWEAGPQSERDFMAKTFHNEHLQIQKAAEQLREKGIDTTALLIQGSVTDTILKETVKLNIDMIIMGTHGHGAMHHLILGSVSEGVVHKSHCPVLIIPTK